MSASTGDPDPRYASPSDDAQESEASPTDPSLSVLLIEDNPGDARLFEEYLEESTPAFTVHHETSLEAGLGALAEARPDVVAVDLGLPDSQGPKTVRAVAAASPSVPIVVLTGQKNLEAALEAQEAGAAEYLQKSELTPALAGRTLRWATQRANMKQKLRQRDAWIRSITENIAGGVFRVGPTGCVEYANKALVQLLGFEREEALIGRDLTTLYADPEARGRMLSEGGADGIEVEFRCNDGSTLVGLLSAEAGYEESGAVLHYDGVIIDITERRDREQELRRSRERLANAQRIAGLGSWERRFETETPYWSDETRRIFGWEADEEVSYETFMDAVHPEDRAPLRWQQERALEEGVPIDIEYRIRRPDGEERIVKELGEAEFGDDGAPVRFAGTVLDVTDRKQRERELRVLSEAVAQARESIVITEAEPIDEPGPRIRYVNAAFETMTGYSADEIVGKTPRVLQGPETSREALDSIRSALERGEGWRGETVNYEKDGTPYMVEWNVAPVRGAEGTIEHWVSVQRDVTERRQREKALKNREAQLRGLANSIPGVVYQFVGRSGGTSQYAFVGEHTEELLGISSRPKDFHERFLEHVPASHRARTRAATEEAVQAGTSLRIEIPFDRPVGERIWLLCTSTPERQDTEEGEALMYNGVMLDITERKRAEEALQEERDRFETLFNGLPTPAMRCLVEENETWISDANVAFEDLFGEGHVVEGEDANELLLSSEELPDGLEEQAPRIEQQALEKGGVQAEVRRATADGLRDFQLQVSGRTPDDGPPEVYAIYTDITERKKTEQALREREDQIRGLTNSVPGILFQFHKTDSGPCRFSFVGNQAESLLGLSPETSSFFDRLTAGIPESHREAFTASIDEAAASGDEWRHQVPFERADGEQMWLLGTATPERRNDTVVFNGVLSDVTQQKETRQQLEESEQRYRTLAEHFPNGAVGVYDHDLRYTLAKGDAAGDTLPSSDQVEGRRMPDVFPDSAVADIEPLFRVAIDEGATESIETGFNGRIWNVWATPLRDAAGNIFAGLSFAQDITEQKHHEEELVTAKEAAEEAARLKSAMMANMSHEVRTPLTSLIGFTEILAEQLEGEHRGFAEKAYQSSKRLMRTLDSVLELSRLEAGTYTLDEEETELTGLVDDVVNTLGPQAERKGVRLRRNLPDAPIRECLSKEAVRRVLRNLVENAVKFTPEGGTVTVHLQKNGRGPVLAVEDTGVGIGEEALPKIFEPFKQESEGLSREYEGNGLGLSIVDELTEALGGTIEVESEKGVGSQFTVRLPHVEVLESRTAS